MKMVDGKSIVDPDALANVKAPVLGMYGGNDARVTATVDPTKAAMAKLNKSYDPHVFEGAGHGFNNQSPERYNAEAAELARHRTLELFERA